MKVLFLSEKVTRGDDIVTDRGSDRGRKCDLYGPAAESTDGQNVL